MARHSESQEPINQLAEIEKEAQIGYQRACSPATLLMSSSRHDMCDSAQLAVHSLSDIIAGDELILFQF
jgi:hypothetical protein